jgi:hypothetical protein
MKTIYYYQSFCGLEKMLTHSEDLDVIIVSSLHFGSFKKNKYIHLNNFEPTSPKFDKVWEEIKKLYYNGVTIMVMLGGAGGAFKNLFSDFEEYYLLLKYFLKSNNFITGIDLDIEDGVTIEDVKKLINRLKTDFGSDFGITMAPIASSLITDGPGSFGNFSYKDLYNSEEGKFLEWFNVQCYGCYNFDTYDKIIKNNYPSDKVVFGMISCDFVDNFEIALTEVKKVLSKYKDMSGVFNWEYIDSPPNSANSSEWVKKMRDITYTNRKFLGIWGP